MALMWFRVHHIPQAFAQNTCGFSSLSRPAPVVSPVRCPGICWTPPRTALALTRCNHRCLCLLIRPPPPNFLCCFLLRSFNELFLNLFCSTLHSFETHPFMAFESVIKQCFPKETSWTAFHVATPQAIIQQPSSPSLTILAFDSHLWTTGIHLIDPLFLKVANSV